MADLTDSQIESLVSAKDRGNAFNEMIRTQGWKYIKAYYENRLQLFVTMMITQDKKDITEFEAERRQLIGMHRLFATINADIETLNDDGDKSSQTNPQF